MSHPVESVAQLPVLNNSERKPSLDNEKSYNEEEKKSVSDVFVNVEQVGDGIYDIKSGLPLPDVDALLPVEGQALTIRAIVVGIALGSVVACSNLYLGLKTGFTFGASLFGAIFGFAILKTISVAMPTWLGGGYFGEKENVTVQTAATAAGGLGILFVSGVPALYQLGLLSKTPKDDIGRLIAFTAACAFFGMSFAIPLRKWYILKQKLVFPTPTATALTIRSLHSGATGAETARLKSRMLGWSFLGAIILRVTSQYAPGVLFDWHPFWWLASWGAREAIRADNWGFFWEWTPAFLGAGILSGVNASVSLYAGGILAWGILGPILMATGQTVARDFSAQYQDYPVLNYSRMSFTDPRGLVSPRYYLLWAGIFIMLTGAFTEIFCNGRSIVTGFTDVGRSGANAVARRRGQPEKYTIAPSIEDPAPPEDQVPTWVWSSLLVATTIFTIVICKTLFEVDVGISILSIFLGFIFSFIGVQCAGDTDINPVSTCAKATQLVVGGATQGKYMDTIVDTANGPMNAGAVRVNLLAALITAGAAAQAADMTGDLKTGHLLKCKPKDQFYAQACGAVVSIFLSVGLFVLFSTAYPCIIDSTIETCPFGIPSVSAWVAVARATSSTNGLPFPNGAGILALVLSIVGMIIIVAKNLYVSEKYRGYMPNIVALGLGFVLPPGQSQYGLVMAVAAISAHYWKKKNLLQYDMFAFPLAAGLIAGEGLGGVVNAIFVIAGIDGGKYGSALGCPGNVFCG